MSDYSILIGKKKVQKTKWGLPWGWEDHYMDFPGTEHVALHSRTGAGKTSSFVIPNLFRWGGSAIVLDVKGEVYEATAGHRYHRLGQRVLRFEPTHLLGQTHRWNPFDVIDRASPKRFDQITRQAFMLFPEDVEDAGKGNKAFWDKAARDAFIAITNLIAESPQDPLAISQVLHVLSRGDFYQYLSAKVAASRTGGNTSRLSRITIEGLTDFLSGSEDLVQGIRKTVTTNLQSFKNPVVASATNESDFDFRDFRRTPTTLYVTISPGDIPRMRPLLRLLFDQFINLNTDITPEQDPELNIPVLLMLDEFARLGKISTLAEAMQYVRGFGIRIALVVQNKAQVTALYGVNSSRDIFDNVGVELVFGTGDIELAAELEKRLGDNTWMFKTVNQPKFMPWVNWKRQNTSEHPHRRPLRYDQEITQMAPHLQLGLRPGMKPWESERVVWWQDPTFKKLRLPPPVVPPLPIFIPMDDGAIQLPAPRQR